MSTEVLPLDQIICGDNCDVLGTLPRECIDLVVTSPPYDDLRTYGGHSWDFYGVAWQLKRVLKPGGVIVWVVADATKDGSETGSSWAQAEHFKALGLKLWDTMIWNKPNPSVPTEGRYYAAWEFMFVLSNGTPKSRNYLTRRNASAGTTYRAKTCIGKDSPGYSGIYKTVADESRRYNVWDFPIGGESFGHRAIFPEDLARDHILSWSNEGDIVLDPFSGSGTTAKMARELGRHYIGIEVNPDYVEISRKRLSQQLLFGVEKTA